MKDLQLPLTKQWFDMTKERIKPEDCREITPYWIKKFLELNDPEGENETTPDNIIYDIKNGHDPCKVIKAYYCKFKDFGNNIMTLGYPKAGDTKLEIQTCRHRNKNRES